MGRLSGKIALITGGTTGIGLAAARLFAAEGAQVLVTGRNAESLAAARQELRGVAEVIASDASDEQQIRELFQQVRRSHGKLDVLFLNAGIAKFAPVSETTDELIEDQIRINYLGPFYALREALPLLGKGASVIVTSSVVTHRGLAGSAAYSASKAALRALALVAANELAPRGVRVNVLSPGPIETPIFGKLGLPQQALAALEAQLRAKVPIDRLGSADEVARSALFLASDESSFVTGHDLGVDGGARVS